MAANNNCNNFSCYYEEPISEKVPACTMKRYPKMDLNKSDMLQLLSYLEGELQARDIVVATLNAEKIKQMTLRAKKHRVHPDDPLFALQRDSEVTRDCSFGEVEVKVMYDDQLNKLENLIGVQHAAQKNMREMLALVEKKYHKMCNKLETERRNHSKDVVYDQHIVKLLQKEKQRLIEEVDKERKRYKHLDDEARKISSQNEVPCNSDHETLIAVQLIKEQTKMMRKMVDLKSYETTLTSELEQEKKKGLDLERAIVEETEKLMHEEAMQEKRLSEFDFERQQLLARLSKAEVHQKELLDELSKLQQQQPKEPINGKNHVVVSRHEPIDTTTTNSCLNANTTTKFPPPGSNQSHNSIKRPSSAQPISSKLQPPFNLRQHQQTTNTIHQLQPQQPNAPRNSPPSLVPTPVSVAPPLQGVHPSRIRTFGNDSSSAISSKPLPTPQNLQGPMVRRVVSQGSKVPPPVPPNKPQVPVLPQVQQATPSVRFIRPSNT